MSNIERRNRGRIRGGVTTLCCSVLCNVLNESCPETLLVKRLAPFPMVDDTSVAHVGVVPPTIKADISTNTVRMTPTEVATVVDSSGQSLHVPSSKKKPCVQISHLRWAG